MPTAVGATRRQSRCRPRTANDSTGDGFLIIRGALTPGKVRRYAGALDRAYAAAVADRRIQAGSSLHQLSAVARCPEAAALVDGAAAGPVGEADVLAVGCVRVGAGQISKSSRAAIWPTGSPARPGATSGGPTRTARSR